MELRLGFPKGSGIRALDLYLGLAGLAGVRGSRFRAGPKPHFIGLTLLMFGLLGGFKDVAPCWGLWRETEGRFHTPRGPVTVEIGVPLVV